MAEESRLHRRQFLRKAAIGATGFAAALTLKGHDTPQDAAPDQHSHHAALTPRSTLILIGGGYPPLSLKELEVRGDTLTAEECDPQQLFRRVMEQSPHQPPVVELITNASRMYAQETARQHELIFRKLGAREVHSIDTHDRNRLLRDPSISGRLRRADIVFITGGDQEVLAELFANTTAYQVLADRYANDPDFVLGGTSAGAMIMAQHMICGNPPRRGDPTPVGSGFCFLPAAIETHMAGRTREARLLSAVEQHPSSIGIGLDEASGIIIRNGRATAIGPGRTLVACLESAMPPLSREKEVALTQLPGCAGFMKNRMHTYIYRSGEQFELGAFAQIPDACNLAPARPQKQNAFMPR